MADDFETAHWMHGKTKVRPPPGMLEKYLLNQYLRQIDAMANSEVKEVRILSSGSECAAGSEFAGKNIQDRRSPTPPSRRLPL